MREEKEERDGGNGQGNDLADVGIEVPNATQKGAQSGVRGRRRTVQG
jgi:hypothetical protein